MSATFTALYCEDVRTEIGNKRSFMGMFVGNICKVPQFPYLFPKLFVVLRTCVVDPEEFPGAQLRIHLDDDSPLVDERMEAFSAPGEGMFATNWREYQFSPFVIEKECRLRILITHPDGREERLPALRFQREGGQTARPDSKSSAGKRRVAPRANKSAPRAND